MDKQPLLNYAIKAQKILLLDQEGQKIGELNRNDAIRRAQEQDLDLMQVGENPNYAICKILNYQSWKYHEDKKRQKQEFKNRSQDLKTINFRPVTGDHDFLLKVKKINEFLEDNHKVKVCIKLKSREASMRSVNEEVVNRIQEALQEFGVLDSKVNWSPKEINFIMKPSKKQTAKPKI